MKKIFVILSLAILPVLALTSCKDDNDPVDLAAGIAGTYAMSDFTVSFAGQDQPVTGASIKITKQAVDKIKFELTGFSIMIAGPAPVSIPVTLNGVTLSGTEVNTVINYTGTVSVSLGQDPVDLPIVIEGNVADKSELTLEMSVTVNAEPLMLAEVEASGDKTGVQ